MDGLHDFHLTELEDVTFLQIPGVIDREDLACLFAIGARDDDEGELPVGHIFYLIALADWHVVEGKRRRLVQEAGMEKIFDDVVLKGLIADASGKDVECGIRRDAFRFAVGKNAEVVAPSEDSSYGGSADFEPLTSKIFTCRFSADCVVFLPEFAFHAGYCFTFEYVDPIAVCVRFFG